MHSTQEKREIIQNMGRVGMESNLHCNREKWCKYLLSGGKKGYHFYLPPTTRLNKPETTSSMMTLIRPRGFFSVKMGNNQKFSLKLWVRDVALVSTLARSPVKWPVCQGGIKRRCTCYWGSGLCISRV